MPIHVDFSSADRLDNLNFDFTVSEKLRKTLLTSECVHIFS